MNFARANRDEPDLREALYEAPLPRPALRPTGRSCSPTSRRAASGCSTSSTTRRSTSAANWSMFSTAGGRPTQYQVRRQLRRAHARLPVAPLPLHPVVAQQDRSPAAAVRRPAAARRAVHADQHRHGFRFNEETRPVDAYDGEQTTTAGYGMVDIALSARVTARSRGARVERFDQDGQHVRSVRPVRAHDRRGEQEHRRLSRRQLRAGAAAATSNLRLSYSATVNRPEFRELAEFEFTDVVGSRAIRGNPDLKRALIQNVDGRWEMFPGGRGILAASVVLQVLRPADRARRHRAARSRS